VLETQFLINLMLKDKIEKKNQFKKLTKEKKRTKSDRKKLKKRR
jgi:hypothetical protein